MTSEIGRVRKGRNSVEEIIVDSLCTIFGTSAANLKMHGCGREDIDVRMLGIISDILFIATFLLIDVL